MLFADIYSIISKVISAHCCEVMEHHTFSLLGVTGQEPGKTCSITLHCDS